MYYYNKNNRKNALELRKNMTPWECKLWFQFLKTLPYKFCKQKCVGNYILDFYCPAKRLAIELDGSQHYNVEDMEYDDKRTEFLKEQGIRVLRYTNDDVYKNFNRVCEEILLVLNK